MSKLESVKVKWNSFYQKLQPVCSKIGAVCGKIGRVCGLICDYIYKFRKIILTIPVLIGAIYMAVMNSRDLPETVGINLLSNGEYAYMVSRSVAVMGPLAVTAACLLLMMCSKKTLYPWIISIFSLAIPVLILLTNQFPA